MILQNIKKNKGFVILFAVTISSILLAIALGVSNIALKEVKFSTSARDTDNAFFAADMGIECALIHDKTSGSIFVNASSPQMSCNGVSSIAATESPTSFWTFVISGVGENNQSCARVTVDKRASPVTTIISKGYNIGNASCLSSNPDRIERELKTSYVGGGLPPPVVVPTSHFTVDTGKTLDNGLAAYWKLNEVFGSRADSLGVVNLTSNNGVPQAIGKVSTAADFTTSSAQFLSSNSSVMQVGNSSFTFAGWFYLDSSTTTQMIFGKDGGAAGQREYRLRYNGATWHADFAVFRPGDVQVTVTDNVIGSLSGSYWNFVVVWYDATAGTLNISINNNSPASVSVGGPLQTTTNGSLFTVGSRQFPGSQSYLDGRVDELGFWKRVLTAQERSDLYNSNAGNTYNP